MEPSESEPLGFRFHPMEEDLCAFYRTVTPTVEYQRSMSSRCTDRLKPESQAAACPRCDSINTKFCYYNNYSLSQPRHFCKTCRRYWTRSSSSDSSVAPLMPLRKDYINSPRSPNRRVEAGGSRSNDDYDASSGNILTGSLSEGAWGPDDDDNRWPPWLKPLLKESIIVQSTTIYDLHPRLGDKSLDDTSKDKINGSYRHGKYSKSPSLSSPTIASSQCQGSKPDLVAVEVAPLEMAKIAYQGQCASSSASMARSSRNDHMQGTMMTTGRGSPEYAVQHCPPLNTNEQAPQGTGEQYNGDNNTGQASGDESSSDLSAQDHQSGAYAAAGADVEAGGCRCTTCCEPLPEPIAMLREPPAVILVAGAFALLSGNPDTFRGPLERVLLGVMIVGFLSSFAWLLMGSRMRTSRASLFLRWTAVWAVFVAFFLIMIILITH